MNFSKIADELDAVVPGVTDAYSSLRAPDGHGIYTSMGAFYNHTLFGRDASMSAKFVADFDHAVTYDTIRAVGALQGVRTRRRTQEEPGRIHHEWRDFGLWKPQRWTDRVGFALARLVWGSERGQMLTYFATDTTANYIRLVNRYAGSIDRSVLDRTLVNRHGDTVAVRDALTAAGDWIVSSIDDLGYFCPRRTSRWSLPYQTFEDSVTAYYWPDGRTLDYRRPIAYVESQAFAIDALQDLARMLPGHERAAAWRESAERMRQVLFDKFWLDDERFFASAIAVRDGHMQPSRVKNITAGWTLNNSFWFDMSEIEREQKITVMVRELFSHDFLTQVGLRSRSRNQLEPLGLTIDYHGSQTIWPMFNFMVAEGLRRHNLPRLAEQIENRIVNGCNAVGNFSEFFVVDHADTLYRESDDPHDFKLWVQFIPERCLAYTVVPMMTIAYRSNYPLQTGQQRPWQAALEDEILASIPRVERIAPDQARAALDPRPVVMDRRGATMRSIRYMMREYRRM